MKTSSPTTPSIATSGAGELLYNGILLPPVWPPLNGNETNGKPPPYLCNIPEVIPIDIGRQLFVDDFLIEWTDCYRSFHHPVKYEGNPVLKPESADEMVGGFLDHAYPLGSGVGPFDDGAFFDPNDQLFKMWVMAGICHATELVYSKDGIHWERPEFDVKRGTNVVIPYDPDFARDGFSPWLDHAATQSRERFKAFYYTRSRERGDSGYLLTSPDGIHWAERATVRDKSIGDDTLMFYNPFRQKWCLSIRRGDPRKRGYYEHGDFMGLASFERTDTVFWQDADPELDPPDPDWVTQQPTQLYTLVASPYESLMLGLISIHYGPENDVCEEGGFPKLCQLKVAFSRDGFHWDRTDRGLFIAATKKDGDWDRAYVRPCGATPFVVGDKLYFYYSADSGYNNDRVPYLYAGGSTHLAILRRDGFASMDAPAGGGGLLTRPMRFSGKHLFVNADLKAGTLTVDVMGADGKVIAPFTAADCVPVRADSTKMEIRWQGATDLGSLAGNPVRFRFHLSDGELYAFWVSATADGASNGYVAAGGPGFSGPMDISSPLSSGLNSTE